MAMRDGDGWVECDCGNRHWGKHGAAGLLLIRDQHLLLQHRAPWVHNGDTWGVPGGARDSHETIVEAAIREAVEETGVIRILGLDCPLDVFRRPNELEEVEFDGVCQRARFRADGTLLPHPTDLIQTKIDTGRDKDRIDIFHLECVIRVEYRARLPQATAAEALDMLERYSDWEVLTVALEHPAAEVRELALAHLREFAAEGDPFSQAVLAGLPLPGALRS